MGRAAVGCRAHGNDYAGYRAGSRVHAAGAGTAADRGRPAAAVVRCHGPRAAERGGKRVPGCYGVGGLVSGEWLYGRICGARTGPHETVGRTVPQGDGIRWYYFFAWSGCGYAGLRIEINVKRAGDDAVDDTLAGAPEHPLVHGGTGCCMPALPIAVTTRLHDACKKHESWQGRGR